MNAMLTRVDLGKHGNRRYNVAIQPTPPDPVAMACVWVVGITASTHFRFEKQLSFDGLS